MCQADSEAFSSFAHAQVTVTNEIYRFLGEPPVFLFCPTGRSEKLCSVGSFVNLTFVFFTSCVTPDDKECSSLSLPVEYCGSLCSPSVSKSPYLQTVGEDLLPDITVVWTGETHVSMNMKCPDEESD